MNDTPATLAAEPETAPAPAAPRRKWRRRLALGAAVLAVLVALVRVALPTVIERTVPVLAERFGFAASLANVDFALLRGHVTLEGIQVTPVAAAAGAPELFSLGRAFVNVEWTKLLGGEVEVAELVLEQPSLSLLRAADGYIELPALPPSTEPKPAEAAPEEPSEPLPILLKSLSIRGTAFHLVDAGGGSDLVDFSLAELGFTNLALLGAKVGLGGIRISEPRLRVRREVQSTRTGARGAAAAPAAPPAGEPAPPPDLRIDDLEIERAEFAVLTEGEPVTVALRLKTTGVTLAPDAPFPLDFGLEAGEGSVALKGKLGLNPLVWDGQVAWQKMTVPMLVRAALPELIPWIESCSAWGDLAVKLDPKGVRASGKVGIDDFAFADPQQELAVGWKGLAIELTEAKLPTDGSQTPIEVALGTISLEAPRARYVLPNTAFDRLLASAGGAPAAREAASDTSGEEAPPSPTEPAAPAAPEPRITLAKLEVRGGAAEFVDRSGEEPYQGRVRDLSIDLTGLALPARTVESVRVRGIAPERAPFDLRATLPGAKGTLSLKLERLPLAQFTPYTARAADLRIPKGDLSLDTKGTLANAGAAGKIETKVVVHQLSIAGGPNAISVAGMPLDMALALLRDPKGDIALPLPLEYGEQGASAGIGAILLGALKAALTGAVTSPIKALGVLMPEGGSAEISFEPIAFEPGSAAPPASTAETLAPLAALLAQRPGLGLALVGSAGEADRLALAERLLIERVTAGDGLPDLEDAGFFARRRVAGALEARGAGEAGTLEPEDEALLGRYLGATRVPAERYADLARRRAEAVRDAFVTQHAASAGRLSTEGAAELGASAVAVELRVAAAQEEATATP